MVRCGRVKQIKRSDKRSGLKLMINRCLPAGTVLIHIFIYSEEDIELFKSGQQYFCAFCKNKEFSLLTAND